MNITTFLKQIKHTFNLATWFSNPRRQQVGISILALVICLLGVGIRLFDLKDPPLDFHMSRQLRSAVIARAVYYQLEPSLDPVLRKQAVDLAGLEVYEPPILEQLIGLTYSLVGSEQVWIARIFLAIFWGAGGLALFYLARRYASGWGSLLGLAFYCFLPFGIIASRSFQPDSWMVFWILLTAASLWRWSEKWSWKWAIFTGILAGLTLLVKVVSGFFLAGMLVGVVGTSLGLRRVWRSGQAWVMALLAATPAAIYYLLVNTQRSADFLSFWTVSLSGMVLTSNFYADWLAMLKSLTGWGFFLAALLGFFLSSPRSKALLAGAWVGYLAYGLVFPYQYVTHEYYHLPLIALMGLSLPPLIDAVLEKLRSQGIFWRLAAGAALLFCCLYALWMARSVLVSQDYSYELAAWRKVGEAIPQGSSFVALTGDYGMRVRYYGWRSMTAGWPTAGDEKLFNLAGHGKGDFETRFKDLTAGKEYFLVTAFSELDAQPDLKEYLNTHYPVYNQGDGYILYDLTHPIKK